MLQGIPDEDLTAIAAASSSRLSSTRSLSARPAKVTPAQCPINHLIGFTTRRPIQTRRYGTGKQRPVYWSGFPLRAAQTRRSRR